MNWSRLIRDVSCMVTAFMFTVICGLQLMTFLHVEAQSSRITLNRQTFEDIIVDSQVGAFARGRSLCPPPSVYVEWTSPTEPRAPARMWTY